MKLFSLIVTVLCFRSFLPLSWAQDILCCDETYEVKYVSPIDGKTILWCQGKLNGESIKEGNYIEKTSTGKVILKRIYNRNQIIAEGQNKSTCDGESEDAGGSESETAVSQKQLTPKKPRPNNQMSAAPSKSATRRGRRSPSARDQDRRPY